MFSALPPHAHIHTNYTPYHPSPLSSSPLRNSPSPLKERDVNAISPSAPLHFEQDYMMTSPTPISKSNSNAIAITSITPVHNKSASLPSPPSSSRGGFSKRTTKVNPLIHGRDDGRETRRKLFLKRVREEGEEKRWKGRERSVNGEGEEEMEMMRCVWVAEERRRKREAEALDFTGEEYELSLDEVMADDVAMEEDAELEALIGQLSQEGVQSGHENEMDSLLFERDTTYQHTPQHPPRLDTPYGSDDEEYDHIFMDVIEEENRTASQQPPSEDQEMMDMS